MTTTYKEEAIKKARTDPNLITSQVFAQVFQAYLECSDQIQIVIREMVKIVNDPSATVEERDSALGTIADALFPSNVLDLEELERKASVQDKVILDQMDREEATFAERLAAIMETRGTTQEQLAELIGVGQPAISMMLTRNCRPQRRTVEKIAEALHVSPEQLWPGIKGD